MKDSPHLNSTVLMRMRASSRRHQFAIMPDAFLPQLWRVVVRVTQHVAHLQGQLLQQFWRDQIVGFTGQGEFCGQWNPQAADADGQMQLPAVPPTVIPTLAPGRFCIYRGMRHFTSQAMFLMPYAAIGAQWRTINGGGSPLGRPRLQTHNQPATQTTNQGGQAYGQLLKAALPGAARRKASVFSQQGTDGQRQGIRLGQKAEQGISGIEAANDHDDQGFDKELVGVGFLSPTLSFLRRW